MNPLIENNDISEMICGENFSYILNDNSAFQATEYKFLQNQKNSSYVKCMKMSYNGKISLYYMTKDLKPFSTMIAYLDADRFLTIVSNLIASILEIRNNGALPCRKIDISLDKIFVDPATYKVSLVYLPINLRMFYDDASFENQLRSALVKVISDVPSICSPKVMQLSMALSNGTFTMADLYNQVKGGKRAVSGPAPKPGNNSFTGTLHLISMNASQRVEIAVTKDEFIIGKSPNTCDGVVSFNKYIGRVHCKVNRVGGKYTITDLTSKNGTYLNSKRLPPEQPCPIRHGDIIRMANVDFQVAIK